MTRQSHFLSTLLAAVSLAILMASTCRAQERPPDHSCSIDAAAIFSIPTGSDGHNFRKGWGFQTGGGIAVHRSPEGDLGNNFYVTAHYVYQKLHATGAALGVAKAANPAQLANATAAHGGFSAATLDLAYRRSWKRAWGVNVSGGFGWLRRDIGFNGANPETLLSPSSISLDRLSSNSGVFDIGFGPTLKITRSGAWAVFAEVRFYRGMAINSGSSLVPISVGIRW
jgi:hypothetical protein